MLAALYHDAVYCPRSAENEEANACLLRSHASDETDGVITEACAIIVASKWDAIPESKLGRMFFEMDTHQLSDGCAVVERLEDERAIFREYQWAPWTDYRSKREEFLRGWGERFSRNAGAARDSGARGAGWHRFGGGIEIRAVFG